MALNKIFFVIGWIFLAYTPSAIEAQIISSSDLEDGGSVCPGVPITLNCTAAGTTSIIWRSQEYIGDPIAISDFRPLDYNVTSASVNTTVATLTRNENGILESTLLIIPTLNRLNSSVVCEHTDSGNLFTFTINVFDNQSTCGPTTTSPLTSVTDQSSTTTGQAPASVTNFALIGLIVFLTVIVV